MSKKVLEQIEPFNEVFYKNCFYSQLFSVVNHCTGNIIPFLLNDTYIYKYKKDSGQFQLGLEINQHSDIPELCKELGIQLTMKHKSDNIIDDIISSIDKNNPVIVFIDMFYESIIKDTYLKNHWIHALLIYGYDDDNKLFYIIDENHRDSLIFKKVEISFTDVVNANNGYLENLYSEEIPSFLSFKKPDENVCADINQKKYIDLFIDNMLVQEEDMINSLEYIKSFSKDLEYAYQNNLLTLDILDRILEGITSIINNKKSEKYTFLRVLGHQPLIMDLMDNALNAWKIIRGMIAKYRFSSSYNQKPMDNCLLKLNQVYEFEISLYKKYYSFLNESRVCIC